MGSRVVEQVNPWGRSQGSEPQRADLWVVDFRTALNGIHEAVGGDLPPVQGYHIQSVSLPELKVKSDVFRRDSRSYQMPGFDEPLEAVRMTFILDVEDVEEGSHVYQFLDKWRRLVRAGRGAQGQEPEIVLNANYRIDYAFNVYAILLTGGSVGSGSTPSQTQTQVNTAPQNQSYLNKLFSTKRNTGSTTSYQPAEDPQEAMRQEQAAGRLASAQQGGVPGGGFDPGNNLQYSGFYILEKMWLSSFKFSDLNYSENRLLTIEAQFYAENILDNSSVT